VKPTPDGYNIYKPGEPLIPLYKVKEPTLDW